MKHKFEVGDTVIALTNPGDHLSQPRVKGNIYTVVAVLYCANCGRQKVNIGPTTDSWHTYSCSSCHTKWPCYGKYWTDSKYFAKVDEDTLKQAVEAEEYEIAQTLYKEIFPPLN